MAADKVKQAAGAILLGIVAIAMLRSALCESKPARPLVASEPVADAVDTPIEVEPVTPDVPRPLDVPPMVEAPPEPDARPVKKPRPKTAVTKKARSQSESDAWPVFEEAAVPKATRKTCCRTCKAGKPCGDSCINVNSVCHKAPGCAC
jgi:hypothetical protein